MYLVLLLILYPIALAALSSLEKTPPLPQRIKYRTSSASQKPPQVKAKMQPLSSLFTLIHYQPRRFTREEGILQPEGIFTSSLGVSIRATKGTIDKPTPVYIEEIDPNYLGQEVPAKYEVISPFFQFGTTQKDATTLLDAAFLFVFSTPQGYDGSKKKFHILGFTIPVLHRTYQDAWRWDIEREYRTCDFMFTYRFELSPPSNSERDVFVLVKEKN